MAELVITAQGKKELEERLRYLKVERRPIVGEHIKTAREYGDLSENSEYDIAREEQASVEAEIFELENKLKSVESIDPKKVKTNKVKPGYKKKVREAVKKAKAQHKQDIIKKNLREKRKENSLKGGYGN